MIRGLSLKGVVKLRFETIRNRISAKVRSLFGIKSPSISVMEKDKSSHEKFVLLETSIIISGFEIPINEIISYECELVDEPSFMVPATGSKASSDYRVRLRLASKGGHETVITTICDEDQANSLSKDILQYWRVQEEITRVKNEMEEIYERMI